MVLLLIGLLVGAFFWWRRRRGAAQRLRGLPVSMLEENIPLNSTHHDEPKGDGGFRTRKGKERAGTLPDEEAIFDVGDTDDEDDEEHRSARLR